MKRDFATLVFFDSKAVGIHAAARLQFDDEMQVREFKIRRLRMARPERELSEPGPALPRGKRPKLSLSRKTDP